MSRDGYYGSDAHISAIEFSRSTERAIAASDLRIAVQDAEIRGYNEAVALGNEDMRLANNEIRRLRALNQDQAQKIAELQARIDKYVEDDANLRGIIGEWQAHADGLDARINDLLEADVSMRKIINDWQEHANRLEATNTDQADALAEHVASHQRSLVFINTVREVLDELIKEPISGPSIRSRFATLYYSAVEEGMDSGTLPCGLEHDQLFAANFPDTHAFMLRILNEDAQESAHDLDLP